MKCFALTGAAGYIAPRHFQAIQDVGGNLLAIFDPNDSVGIIDRYFPKAHYFRELERFDRYLEKQRLTPDKTKIDYVSICSPNYLHDAHIRQALKSDADAICEKPVVLSPWNLESLQKLQDETKKKIHAIQQLRLHPEVQKLKSDIKTNRFSGPIDIDLTYITPRGNWYDHSWKGDESKSGGICMNIGVHFFDMLIWIFGDVISNHVHHYSPRCASGFLQLKTANVRWFLSINENDLPHFNEEQKTQRHLTINGEAFDFSKGFENLHTKSYQEILSGNGFDIHDSAPAIELIYGIRNQKPDSQKGETHPLLRLVS